MPSINNNLPLSFKAYSFEGARLFDEDRYDDNDVPVTKTRTTPGQDWMSRNYDTSPLDGYHYVTADELPSINYRAIKDSLQKRLDNKLRAACSIEGEEGKKFDENIYKYLLDKKVKGVHKKEFYSTGELIDICKTSKLRREDNTEYFDYDMADAGLYWSNRFVSNGNSDLKKILKSLVVKDNNGGEIFFKEGHDYTKYMSRNLGARGTLTPEKILAIMQHSIEQDETGNYILNKETAKKFL